MNIPSKKCYHGGAFFKAIGEKFDTLEIRQTIINADVLDAWFEPSPLVIKALSDHLPWLLKTSPPTDCSGMVEVIAEKRGVKTENILVGAGSSSLIFLAFLNWLDSQVKVLILDPMYGEYSHVLDNILRCKVDRIFLNQNNHYKVNLNELESRLSNNYDLIVLVNPNSPTGQYIQKEELAQFLIKVPPETRVWVDETYIEYVGSNQSLEQLAAQSENIIVCKSMSKVYALSGVRAAYLCSAKHQLDTLRLLTPPWAVSLPGQIAAITALQDRDYYQQRYEETHQLREEFIQALNPIKAMTILPSVANFILCHLNDELPDASTVVRKCRTQGLYIRDVSNMSQCFNSNMIRIAIKDRETNQSMVTILNQVLMT